VTTCWSQQSTNAALIVPPVHEALGNNNKDGPQLVLSDAVGTSSLLKRSGSDCVSVSSKAIYDDDVIGLSDDDTEFELFKKEMSALIPRKDSRPQISMKKYVDFLLSAIETVVNISADKLQLAKCLNKVLKQQFGSSYVKDLFSSYGSNDERNQLIFELQTLRSLYFADNYNILEEDSPQIGNKRKFPLEYHHDSDEDLVVTYLDKPGKLL
jgi:hypothetical protein